MSAFYDQASLVVVPSGYKSGKIYAQKPLTTDGQLTFTRASTATRVNASGLIESVASGVPRLDYTDSTCPKLLLEPQRTNLQPYSEDLTNAAAWSMGGATISGNAAASPDGTTTADKMVESATNARHELYSSSIAFSGTSSVSIFAKADGRRYFSAITGGDPNLGGATYDLQTGTVAATSGGTTASIVAFPNGWYRCTFTTTRTNTSQVYYCLRTSGASPNVETYTGDGTSGILFWGGQVEVAGAYPTSYIRTPTTAVTRVADYAAKTGISSLIGQTEGTVFAEFEVTHEMTGNNILFSVSDGTTAQNIYANIFLSAGVNRIEYVVNNGGVLQMNASSAISNGTHKIALAYKANDFAVFIDGTQVHTDTSGTVPATSRLGIGTWVVNSLNYSDRISQALLFKTRLTNAQLAELTTL
jgi:hypothetical protein